MTVISANFAIFLLTSFAALGYFFGFIIGDQTEKRVRARLRLWRLKMRNPWAGLPLFVVQEYHALICSSSDLI